MPDNYQYPLIQNAELRRLAETLLQGGRASVDDAVMMLSTPDVMELGMLANAVRRQKHGVAAYYGVSMNLNYTNVCDLRCPLCAFSRDADADDAYTLTLEGITERVTRAVSQGVEEIHIVGGLNPELPLEYFEEMVIAIKNVHPDLFVVGFTATEYDYWARQNDMPVRDVLERLRKAGVGALPGGGAEIFAPDVRTVIAPGKISGQRWLDVMREAHGIGLKTNASLLYNHIEQPEHIADHLARLRDLQDQTNGFKCFVPLAYHDRNTDIPAKRTESSGFSDLRLYATARIFLDNIPHLKALWMYVGEAMAQVLLSFGVDDLGSTYWNERVVHSAGARTQASGTEKQLLGLIRDAGYDPVKTCANYVENNTTG